jgi:hypothetical protein
VSKTDLTKRNRNTVKPAGKPLRGPSTHEEKAFALAAERHHERHERVQVKTMSEGSHVSMGAPHSDHDSFVYQLQDAFGTNSPDFSNHVMGTLAQIAKAKGAGSPNEREVNSALAFMDGFKPTNEVEAALIAQAYASFTLAMDMAARARASDTYEGLNSFASISTKMMRTYTMQMEALAKMRRGGEQTVRVEHVHVYEGGQAVVGVVNQGGGTGGKSSGQSYKPDAAAALGPALLGQDTAGYGMPIPGHAREEAVPHPRRD